MFTDKVANARVGSVIVDLFHFLPCFFVPPVNPLCFQSTNLGLSHFAVLFAH